MRNERNDEQVSVSSCPTIGKKRGGLLSADKTFYIAVGLIVLFGLSLRLIELNAQDLTVDEQFSTCFLNASWAEFVEAVGPRAPLPFFFQMVIMKLLRSDAPYVIRLAGVIEGAAAIAVLALFLRRIAGPATGIVAAWILAFSHFHWVWSRDARYYPLYMLISLLLLWVYWEFLLQPTGRKFGGLVVAMALVSLCHLSASLFLVSLAAAFPCFIASSGLLGKLKAHWRLAAAAPVPIACILLLVPRTRVVFFSAIKIVTDPKPVEMTHNFDIAPEFLLNRFVEFTGVNRPWVYVLVLVAAVGFACLCARKWRLAVVTACIVILPFVAIWTFRPRHFWELKYFIFMLPVILLWLAVGTVSLADAAANLLKGPSVCRFRGLLKSSLVVAGVALLTASNLQMILADMEDPVDAYQEAAILLDKWVEKGEPVLSTFQWHPGVFDPYLSPDGPVQRVVYVESDTRFDMRPESHVNKWYLHYGKRYTNNEQSSVLLSPLFSRIALHRLFIAFGPNVQGIDFGKTFPGAPVADGPLLVAPGAPATFDVMFPEDETRMLLVKTGSADLSKLSVSCSAAVWPELFPFRATPDSEPLMAAVVRVPFGRSSITVDGEGLAEPVAVQKISFLPVLQVAGLTLPAWDFYEMRGGKYLHNVFADVPQGKTIIRMMAPGAAAYYPFFSADAKAVRLSVEGINDRPIPCCYAVELNGGEPRTISFDRRDDSVETKDAGVFQVVAGENMLKVKALAPVTGEALSDHTNIRSDLIIRTPERMSINGIISTTLSVE